MLNDSGHMWVRLKGDTFGVDVATISGVVTAVTDCIFDLKDSAIQFLTTDRHRHRTKTGIHALRGFPSVISAVDGTHVRIQTPSEDEEQCIYKHKCHLAGQYARCPCIQDLGIVPLHGDTSSWP
ncbi:hypothetical protein MAR_025005 [Mya arenaria]|uniref:DDE Tnp4 domain-containing protein n=1 Tax=Mya arenaria TaxID=6604 RepID=A0ABY7DSF5_MYAAR|nr:hypothetical protein MAR_025005 [Mya arenaria]